MTGFTNPAIKPTGFTIRYSTRSPKLESDVDIFPAFVPGQHVPAGKRYRALYDTGATHSAVSPALVADLGLPSIGAIQVGHGGGASVTTQHLVNIALPNKVMFASVTVSKMNLAGFDVIIGMDILGNGDFAVTHQGGKTTFSFCLPSRREIDFVAEIDHHPQMLPAVSTKVGRNALCPCGSQKKYKHCHGQ